MDDRTAVVDERNQFVRWATREEIHSKRLVHRTIHVMVLDHTGERMLIQRRQYTKRTYPGHWDLACAGHVEASEAESLNMSEGELTAAYLTTAQRELFEELGITVTPIELGHFGPIESVHYEQLRLYKAFSDGPFRLQDEEVAEAKFVTRDQLRSMLSDANEKLTDTLLYFGPMALERGWW